jgi:hypothetical protein
VNTPRPTVPHFNKKLNDLNLLDVFPGRGTNLAECSGKPFVPPTPQWGRRKIYSKTNNRKEGT